MAFAKYVLPALNYSNNKVPPSFSWMSKCRITQQVLGLLGSQLELFLELGGWWCLLLESQHANELLARAAIDSVGYVSMSVEHGASHKYTSVQK